MFKTKPPLTKFLSINFSRTTNGSGFLIPTGSWRNIKSNFSSPMLDRSFKASLKFPVLLVILKPLLANSLSGKKLSK